MAVQLGIRFTPGSERATHGSQPELLASDTGARRRLLSCSLWSVLATWSGASPDRSSCRPLRYCAGLQADREGEVLFHGTEGIVEFTDRAVARSRRGRHDGPSASPFAAAFRATGADNVLVIIPDLWNRRPSCRHCKPLGLWHRAKPSLAEPRVFLGAERCNIPPASLPHSRRRTSARQPVAQPPRRAAPRRHGAVCRNSTFGLSPTGFGHGGDGCHGDG